MVLAIPVLHAPCVRTHSRQLMQAGQKAVGSGQWAAGSLLRRVTMNSHTARPLPPPKCRLRCAVDIDDETTAATAAFHLHD